MSQYSVPNKNEQPECTSLDMYKLLEDNNCLEEDFQKYQLAEDEKMCEQDLKQLNLTNEENPSKGETSSNESALIEYKSVVIYKSKAVLHFFQNHFKYVDLIPRPELEPEDKDIGNSEIIYTNSCCFMPSFMLLISLLQIIILLLDLMESSNLRFDCFHKTEVWRFWTYFLVYDRYYNIFYPCTDVLIQLLLGFPMEKVYKPYKVIIIYLTGVISGSLLQSVYNHDILLGARGGVYALLISHAINVFLNRKQFTNAKYHLGVTGMFIIFDICWYKMNDSWIFFLNDGILAHVGGIIAGVLVGIHLLRSNVQSNVTEKYIKYTSLSLFLMLACTAIVMNCVLLR